MEKSKFDFGGYATRNDLLCTDGRTIRQNAFKGNDGAKVPIVWNHEHNDVNAVLGHAILENRDDGVYAYGVFNDAPQGITAKKLVDNGDVRALSIWANDLKQIGNDVVHGNIKELSLVLAGANPGAYVDFVMAHGDGEEDTLYASYDENITIFHSADQAEEKKPEDKKVESKEDDKKDGKRTIQDVLDTFNEDQMKVLNYIVSKALAENGEEDDESEKKGDNEDMKHNVFEKDDAQQGKILSHSDEMGIIELAKQGSVGSLQQAMRLYAEDQSGTLAHGVFDNDVEALFPEYELLEKGEPNTLERDQSWIDAAIAKAHKAPYSRLRTRNADARIAEFKAKGYQSKGDYKKEGAQIKLLSRTTDPQTVYIKDTMHRDDITDITDFDVVAYQWRMMRHVLNEELAMAMMVGDGREDGDPDKIHEEHIRPIWTDDELYTIHADVDIEAAKTKLQGTNTGANFGDSYIYAEAIIESALYAREKFKGSGVPDMYCTPHLLNVMLLARDLNGRRIYTSKADLAAALNVGEIHTAEQFEGLVRTDKSGKKHKLLALFVNLNDYTIGATRGGEIAKFENFDMDFNRYKYMLETRLSGTLTKVYSAIALEEPQA